LVAGLKRLQESLRSLEEFSKPISPPLACEWEQLRYRAYTLERAAGLTFTSRQQLASTQLYALLDGCHDQGQFADRAQCLIAAGVDAIQFRDKSLADRELLERAQRLRQITRERDSLMVVNDRPDLAIVAQADGVHVGRDDLSVHQVRTIVGTNMLIGVSTHTIEQARQAVWDGANYLGVGPTFPSTTKSFDHFPGCELLRAVAREITLPAFAIGGITPQNLPSVLATGFRRIAVGAALSSSHDPEETVSELRRQLAETADGRPESPVLPPP
jgi:thiamine-phosphate pyrophosphorylase